MNKSTKENNNFQKWNPTIDVSTRLYFFELRDQKGELIIFLKKFDLLGRLLKLTFTGVLAYRVVVEAGKLKTLNDKSLDGCFFTVTHSLYLKDILEESGGIFEDSNLIHYSIWTGDKIIDIISGPPVESEWVVAE